MDGSLRSQLERALGQPVASAGKARAAPVAKPSKALQLAAQELLARALRLATTELAGTAVDRDALDTACLALQLPYSIGEAMKQSSMGVMSLSDRCGQAAELLVGIADDEESAVDLASRILIECPKRATVLPEARVLADAINLEDFGLAGLCRSTALIVRPGGSLSQLADAFRKREQYGYWEARLKDGFHFASTRALAAARLIRARESIRLLLDELESDLA